MNKIVIHNNNINLSLFDNRIRFTTNDDVDNYISTDTIPELIKKEFDLIFIKDNLSTNYIELLGIRVAYHIRLSQELKDKRYIPIVILSDVDSHILNKLNPIAKILFTKNIFIIPNTQEAIEKISKKNFRSLTLDEYKNSFLNKIIVEQPKDYLTHHSIANEWSIYRWGEFLKVKSDAIIKNKENIEDILYFKYLLAKNPIEKTKGITFAPKSPQATGSILYIDDQWDDGWSDIFNKYFSKSNDINFNTFEYKYKDKNKFTILKDIKDEIIFKQPDIVILDLRLTQNDHNDIKNDEDIELLTGIKVLNTIKAINKGIQVIIITASNQTLILEKLYNYGILGYIKKEHPKYISVSTKENFNKLKNLIDNGLENKYLKDIWTIQTKILQLNLFKNSNSGKVNDIKLDINSIFEILDSKMQSSSSLIIITFTKILENISSLYINEHTMRYLDDNTDIGVYDHKQNKVYDFDNEKWFKNTQNRLHNILYEKLDVTQKHIHTDICELINCRNYIAHPNEKKPVGCNLITEPTQDYILKWFNMLGNILEKINIKNNI